MKKSKRKTKADELREDYIRIIETDIEIKNNGGYKHCTITKENTTWEELKAMYDKRVEKYRALERDYNKLNELSKHTKFNEDSPTLLLYKKIIRAIIMEGNEKTEEDIFFEIGSEEKKYDEKKFSKKFKAWKRRNPELYNKIFYDICYEEFQKKNLKPSEPFYFITTTQ